VPARRYVTTVHLTNAHHATSGGIRTFYAALLTAANRERRRVVLIVPAAESSRDDVGEFGCIYYVRAPRAPAFDRRYRMLLPHRYLPMRSAILAILEREAPDVIEICDKYALPYLAAMLRKGWMRRMARPALVGLSCERFDDNMAAYVSASAPARSFTQWYIRHIYGPPFDAHIAISDYTARELRAALWDRAPGFVRTCAMGVDSEGFGAGLKSSALRARFLALTGAQSDSVILLYAGRLSPEKNIPLLVEMMRALARDARQDYRLILAGDGPLSEWVRAQSIGELAGRIALCGNLDRSALAEAYATCDIFVHPNPREPFGIGPLEAMASGVPVVLPDSGGVLEYASERNAWLAPADAVEFAAAVRSASLGDPARVTAAAVTVRAFRWETVTRRYFAAYDEIALRFSARGTAGRPPAAGGSARSAKATSERKWSPHRNQPGRTFCWSPFKSFHGRALYVTAT
jgi:alpha-1,6-mannosyltransferase